MFTNRYSKTDIFDKVAFMLKSYCKLGLYIPSHSTNILNIMLLFAFPSHNFKGNHTYHRNVSF